MADPVNLVTIRYAMIDLAQVEAALHDAIKKDLPVGSPVKWASGKGTGRGMVVAHDGAFIRVKRNSGTYAWINISLVLTERERRQ